MSDPIPPQGLTVERSALATQMKAQLRIGLAALAGMMIGRMVNAEILPEAFNTPGLSETLAGVAIYFGTAAWQWARVKLVHLRFWRLAIDPDVPAELVRPAPTSVPSA